jgi:hypothetical protein
VEADATGGGVADAADALYRLHPDEFMAARRALTEERRAAGDRVGAAAVAGLRKPTVAAWVTNTVVRALPAEVDALLALGAQLRNAERMLDPQALRQLTQERAKAVQAVVRAARGLAREAGRPVPEAVGWDVEATLHLALANDDVAAAVLSGVLVAVAKHGTADAADVRVALADATAAVPALDQLSRRRARRAADPGAGRTGTTRAVAPAAAPTGTPGGGAAAEGDAAAGEAAARAAEEARARAARAERQARLTRARQAADEAAQARGAAEQGLAAARTEMRAAEDLLAGAERAVSQARRALVAAEAAARDADLAHTDALRAADSATRRLERATADEAQARRAFAELEQS